jgi:hypothetical protein
VNGIRESNFNLNGVVTAAYTKAQTVLNHPKSWWETLGVSHKHTDMVKEAEDYLKQQ